MQGLSKDGAIGVEQKAIAAASLSQAGMSKAFSWLLIGILGAVEGIYGRTQYLGDWISYLNVSRAVSALDWKAIFDPMWTPGYPALVALVRIIFPRTAEGEWFAITLLNWLIFLFAFGSWQYLIRVAIEFYDPHRRKLASHPIVLLTGGCAFLAAALCLDRVSDVCPDLFVTALFIFATAEELALLNRPGAVRAIRLGAVLGVACWVKGVFLPFSVSFMLVLVIACISKRLSWRIWALSGLGFLALFAPYLTAISWSYGEFTFGVSGVLNYAFHVNHMPHWTNWQSGPAVFGAPLHPTRQVVSDLPVFEFGEPFRTTYPPYNNIAYWYQGFRSFYSIKLQMLAIAHTLYVLAGIIRTNRYLCALALSLFLIALNREWRRSFQKTARALWPLFVPAILGVIIYLASHVEDRYLSPFCLILSLLPLLPLLDRDLISKKRLAICLSIIYTVGAAAELKVADGPAFRAALNRDDFHRDPQWKLAAALPSYELKRGDTVAVINENNLGYHCHWAYVDGLRIVAEFGSRPWTLAPWDRTRLEHSHLEPADEDYTSLFWNKLTRERRAQVIDAFRRAGARAVLSLSCPEPPSDPGWQAVAGTHAWIYRFATETQVSVQRQFSAGLRGSSPAAELLPSEHQD